MEKAKTVLNFNNRREIVELRITVPGHPEKRVKLISYQDLDGHVPGFVPRINSAIHRIAAPCPVSEPVGYHP